MTECPQGGCIKRACAQKSVLQYVLRPICPGAKKEKKSKTAVAHQKHFSEPSLGNTEIKSNRNRNPRNHVTHALIF